MFQKLTGTKLVEVLPRLGGGVPDVIAGRVDLFFDSTPAALPYVKSGQVKARGAGREPPPADARCADHDGSGVKASRSILDRFRSAKTPPDVIARLQQEIAQASATSSRFEGRAATDDDPGGALKVSSRRAREMAQARFRRRVFVGLTRVRRLVEPPGRFTPVSRMRDPTLSSRERWVS